MSQRIDLNELKPCSVTHRDGSRIFGWYTGFKYGAGGKFDYDIIMVPIIDDDDMFSLHVADASNDEVGDAFAAFVPISEVEATVAKTFPKYIGSNRYTNQ